MTLTSNGSIVEADVMKKCFKIVIYSRVLGLIIFVAMC